MSNLRAFNEKFEFNGVIYPKITLQMIFDLAWKEFIVNEANPCVDKLGLCAYDNRKGGRCAIGLAIPPDHPALYNRSSFAGLVKKFPGIWGIDVLNLDPKVQDRFQLALHDIYVPRDSENPCKVKWSAPLATRKMAYENVARALGLTIPPSGE